MTKKYLYKVIYQEAKGERKSYISYPAILQSEQNDLIKMIKSENPNWKKIELFPLMCIQLNEDDGKTILYDDEIDSSANKFDAPFIKRAIRNKVLVNVARQISKLVSENVIIQTVEECKLKLECDMNVKQRVNGSDYMIMITRDFSIFESEINTKKKIKELISWLNKNIIKGIKIEWDKEESYFNERSIPTNNPYDDSFDDSKNAKITLTKAFFALRVSISDAYMNKLYDKTRKFLSTLN